MTNESNLPDSRLTNERIDRILSPDHPLCREDVVWMLEYIKKRWLTGTLHSGTFRSHAY